MSTRRGGDEDHGEVTIETLRTPPVQIPPAPLWRRLTAAGVDLLLIMGPAALTLFSGKPLLTVESYLQIDLFAAGFILSIALAYFSILEGFFGLTVGKYLLKLRVLTTDGDPCDFRAAFIRNLLRCVDWLPFFYVVGAASVLVSSKRQRIGDRVARTIVSQTPERDINPPPAPFLFH